MNKKILIPSLALIAFVGIGSNFVKTAHAEENRKLSPMLQGLVEKFNLNESEVATFVNDQRDANRAQVEADKLDRLNTAVSEGKLTEDQKNALLAKQEENKANRESMQELTREERDTKIKENRDAMKTWAEDNGIDLSVLERGENDFHGKRQFNMGL